MDISSLLQAIDGSLYTDIVDHNATWKHLKLHTTELPDLADVQVALVGLTESEGTIRNKGVQDGVDDIRQKFYRLKRHAGAFKVADLGNVRRGANYLESLENIRMVAHHLMNRGILPIFFGGSHDLTYGIYQGYEGLDKRVSVVNVDATTDMAHYDEGSHAERHIHELFLHQPNYLFNYCLLGYQSYLADPVTVDMLHRLFFDAIRLGSMRQDFAQVEPLVREADMLSFDLTAIRSGDAPGNAYAQPFGLTGEEACQLCWYAGHSDKLSSVGIFEYNPELDNSKLRTASVVATMIWYVIEGYYHRKNDLQLKENDYVRYAVDMGGEPELLVFFKSRQSEKWWMEVPYEGQEGPYALQRLVPCSYAEYQQAAAGEVPERWISMHNKLKG